MSDLAESGHSILNVGTTGIRHLWTFARGSNDEALMTRFVPHLIADEIVGPHGGGTNDLESPKSVTPAMSSKL
jgi:hypothetical protein